MKLWSRDEKQPLRQIRRGCFALYTARTFQNIKIPGCFSVTGDFLNIQVYCDVFPTEHSFARRERIQILFCILKRHCKACKMLIVSCVGNRVPVNPLEIFDFISGPVSYFPLFLIAACAAARRAIGTRNGEQET